MLPFLSPERCRLITVRKWFILPVGLILLITPEDNSSQPAEMRKPFKVNRMAIKAVPALYTTSTINDFIEGSNPATTPNHFSSAQRPLMTPRSLKTFQAEPSLSRQKRYANTCGDGVLDPDEDCDCGTNCSRNPCCDGATCLFINGAECSDGECCSIKNCKLRTHHAVCRPAKNACDLPETCSGHIDCPPDAFKRNGEICADDINQGYCYNRECMSRTLQCVDVWGIHSTTAMDECYHQFNTRGVFNGHCGLSTDGAQFNPCASSDVFCGNLHCRGGGYTPKITATNAPSFATQILTNSTGSIIQCKSKSPEIITENGVEEALVKDGTKCGDSKVCLKGHCVSFEFIMTAVDCPIYNGTVCSGHGFCTDLGICYCAPGFGGPDCGHTDNSTLKKPFPYYGYNMLNLRRGAIKDAPTGSNEKQSNNAFLQIVVIAISVVVLGLVLLIMSLTCCGNHNRSSDNGDGFNSDPQNGSIQEADPEAVTTAM